MERKSAHKHSKAQWKSGNSSSAENDVVRPPPSLMGLGLPPPIPPKKRANRQVTYAVSVQTQKRGLSKKRKLLAGAPQKGLGACCALQSPMCPMMCCMQCPPFPQMLQQPMLPATPNFEPPANPSNAYQYQTNQPFPTTSSLQAYTDIPGGQTPLQPSIYHSRIGQGRQTPLPPLASQSAYGSGRQTPLPPSVSQSRFGEGMQTPLQPSASQSAYGSGRQTPLPPSVSQSRFGEGMQTPLQPSASQSRLGSPYQLQSAPLSQCKSTLASQQRFSPSPLQSAMHLLLNPCCEKLTQPRCQACPSQTCASRPFSVPSQQTYISSPPGKPLKSKPSSRRGYVSPSRSKVRVRGTPSNRTREPTKNFEPANFYRASNNQYQKKPPSRPMRHKSPTKQLEDHSQNFLLGPDYDKCCQSCGIPGHKFAAHPFLTKPRSYGRKGFGGAADRGNSSTYLDRGPSREPSREASREYQSRPTIRDPSPAGSSLRLSSVGSRARAYNNGYGTTHRISPKRFASDSRLSSGDKPWKPNQHHIRTRTRSLSKIELADRHTVQNFEAHNEKIQPPDTNRSSSADARSRTPSPTQIPRNVYNSEKQDSRSGLSQAYSDESNCRTQQRWTPPDSNDRMLLQSHHIYKSYSAELLNSSPQDSVAYQISQPTRPCTYNAENYSQVYYPQQMSSMYASESNPLRQNKVTQTSNCAQPHTYPSQLHYNTNNHMQPCICCCAGGCAQNSAAFYPGDTPDYSSWRDSRYSPCLLNDTDEGFYERGPCALDDDIYRHYTEPTLEHDDINCYSESYPYLPYPSEADGGDFHIYMLWPCPPYPQQNAEWWDSIDLNEQPRIYPPRSMCHYHQHCNKCYPTPNNTCSCPQACRAMDCCCHHTNNF